VGGVFVAASAMGALADSPSPATLVPTVTGNTLSLSGTLFWGGKCSTSAGVGIIWNDTGDLGRPAPGDASKLVGLTGSPGGASDGNLVQPASCAGGSIVFGPLTHTYVAALPSQVCAIAYHVTAGHTNSAFHSIYEADAPGQLGNTDNSILEPTNGGQQIVCATVVKKQPDVTIEMTAFPDRVLFGDKIAYHIVVSNLALAAAATAQTQLLTDTLDPNTTFESVTTGPGWSGCTHTVHTVNCSYPPSLAISGRAPEIVVVANVLDGGEANIDNVAHVDNGVGNPDDANPNNQTADVRTPVSARQTPPDLAIDKTATPKVNVGESITYTMTVTNTGGSKTTDPITVTDPLPNGVTYVSGTGTNWNCSGTQSLTCAWQGAALDPGDSTTTITVLATAEEAAVPSVTNTAKAHMGNLTVEDSATTIVNTPVNLTLHKSADPPSGSDVLRGQDIDYTLHYANTGTTDADDVTISDAVPVGTTLKPGTIACTTTCDVATTGTTVFWHLDIPAGTSGDATFSVTVDDDATNGQIIDNVGEITFKGHRTPSNHTKHRVFVPHGDLKLHKSVTPTTATVGTVLNYTLDASASGNIDQTGVVVKDAIPDGTTYKAGSADCASPCVASFDSASDVVTWDVGTISPGQTKTLTFAVTVDGPDAAGTLPTEIDNVGQIRSHETPPEPSNLVVVPVTVVLGEKIVNPPVETLPFTGFNVLQNALLALVLVGGGLMLLTWPRMQPAYRRISYRA
jgi:uncharacterized repeat protein (TIGR01451 family)